METSVWRLISRLASMKHFLFTKLSFVVVLHFLGVCVCVFLETGLMNLISCANGLLQIINH